MCPRAIRISLLAICGLVAVASGVRTEAAPVSASACGYDPATRTVTVTLGLGGALTAPLASNDQIGLGDTSGFRQCGVATTTNTDLIAVRAPDHEGNVAPGLALPVDGTLEPGFTDEPGKSDEIELDVDFGRGGGFLHLRGNPFEPIDVALGRDEVNMNAGEKGSIDADLALREAFHVTVLGLSPRRHAVDGSGGHGTPAEPFGIRIQVMLFSGRASLIARGGIRDDSFSTFEGDDFIAGGPGNDSASTQGGQDELVGGPGNDLLRAGEGNDDLRGGPGTDRLIAEGGRDRCRGSADDRFFGCERRG